MFKSAAVPLRLLHHQASIQALAPETQRVRFYQATWERYFPNDPDLRGICERFSGSISRADLFAYGKEAIAGDYPLRRWFLATMMWGYGIGGRGPWRTRNMLSDAGKLERLREVIEAVCTGKLQEAYTSLKLPWCGPAFLTKFLYFVGATLEIKPAPLILDSRVAVSLNTLAADGEFLLADFVRFAPHNAVARYPEGYVRFVAALDGWATALGVRPDALELFLFDPPSSFTTWINPHN